MSGGGGTTKNVTEPPAWMVPYLQDIAGQAQSQYQSYAPSFYPNSTVAPQSGDTQSALLNLSGYGQSGYNQNVLQAGQAGSQTLQNASNPAYNPVLGGGQALAPGNLNFLQSVQQRAQAGMPGVNPGPAAQYGNNLDPTGTLNRLQNQTTNVNVQTPQTDPTAIENLAGATGAGTANALNSQLNQTPGFNPYIDQLVNRALSANTQDFNQGVMPQISNASQMEGGYGGTRQGVAQGVAIQGLASANADTAGQIYSNQYNQDLQRQLQAAQLGSNVSAQGSQTELSRTGQAQNYGLNLAQLQAGNTQADLARQLSAAGGAGQLGLGSGQLDLSAQTAGQNFLQNAYGQGLEASQQGLGLLTSGYAQGQDSATRNMAFLPALQQMGMTGINAQGQAGSIQDQYSQAQLADLVSRWDYNQNLPYNQLNQYASTVMGGAGAAGSQSSQSGGGTGGAAGALGGAATGAGLAAASGAFMTAGAVNMWNPVGWGMVGIGALLGSGILG